MAASPSEYYRSASVADVRSAARSEILGLVSEPISVALMHAAPPAKVPEIAEYLRYWAAHVTIIVLESGARGNLQQLYTSELHEAKEADNSKRSGHGASWLFRGRDQIGLSTGSIRGKFPDIFSGP